MALAPNINGQILFGPNFEQVGTSPDTTIKFKLSDIGVTGDTSQLSGEGIILALLQHLEKVQGSDVNRVMEIRSSPIFTSKGGEPAIGQNVTVRIFSTVPVASITPNQV